MKRMRRSMRIVFVSSVTAYRALFNWTSPAMYVGTLLAGPFFQLLFFVCLGRYSQTADTAFYVIGTSILGCTMACIFGGVMAIANERQYGTLGVVMSSPANRPAVFIGRGLPYIVNGFVVSGFVYVCGSLIFGSPIPLSRLPMLCVILAVCAASASALGLLLGSFGLRARDIWVVANLGTLLIILASGATVPDEKLPHSLQVIGGLMPLRHGIDSARALAAGDSLASVVAPLGLEAALVIVYSTLAALMLHVLEIESRRHGTLETL